MITRSGTPLCPAWCIALHLDADETLHYGASREVSVVTRAPAPHRERQHAFALDTLVLVQHQEHHERVPWVAILLRGGPVLDLTADSARRLGANLADASAR